jgi:hypothetical protein
MIVFFFNHRHVLIIVQHVCQAPKANSIVSFEVSTVSYKRFEVTHILPFRVLYRSI